MIDGLFTPPVYQKDEVMPNVPNPVNRTGLYDSDKAEYIYSEPYNQNPTLSIVDYIYDEALNPIIRPGHYELALSDGNDFLFLIQSRSLIAKIPVFKIEEDKTEAQKIYDKKEQRKTLKEKKKQDKIDAKYKKAGIPLKQPYVYSNATIEYIKDGEYYLIMYEKGSIRAWGAIKG